MCSLHHNIFTHFYLTIVFSFFQKMLTPDHFVLKFTSPPCFTFDVLRSRQQITGQYFFERPTPPVLRRLCSHSCTRVYTRTGLLQVCTFAFIFLGDSFSAYISELFHLTGLSRTELKNNRANKCAQIMTSAATITCCRFDSVPD